jgi:hypothetical protein
MQASVLCNAGFALDCGSWLHRLRIYRLMVRLRPAVSGSYAAARIGYAAVGVDQRRIIIAVWESLNGAARREPSGIHDRERQGMSSLRAKYTLHTSS